MTIIDKSCNLVRESLRTAESGHDWWHIQRVRETAVYIARQEGANLLICELSAIFHEYTDPKFLHEPLSVLFNFLRKNGLSEKETEMVTEIIQRVSFSSENHSRADKSVELMVVQDADRLDAMGAIGIARTFNYGGYKNRIIFDPEIKPRSYSSREEYHDSNSPTLNHFNEKLLLLKDLMNTPTGKSLAHERHDFMVRYLEQFHKEWNMFKNPGI